MSTLHHLFRMDYQNGDGVCRGPSADFCGWAAASLVGNVSFTPTLGGVLNVTFRNNFGGGRVVLLLDDVQQATTGSTIYPTITSAIFAFDAGQTIKFSEDIGYGIIGIESVSCTTTSAPTATSATETTTTATVTSTTATETTKTATGTSTTKTATETTTTVSTSFTATETSTTATSTTLSPSSVPTLVPTGTPAPTATPTFVDVFNCSNSYYYATGDPSVINTTVSQAYSVLPVGSSATVRACLPGLAASATFSVPTVASTSVTALLLDTNLYSDWLNIRISVKVADPNYNTKTTRNTVYVRAVGNSATRTGSCTPSTTGLCTATITGTSAWLADPVVSVYYGLSATFGLQTLLGTAVPVADEPASYTNNLLVHIPSRPRIALDTFTVVVEGRAPADIESSKFKVFFEDTSNLEIIGTPTGLNGVQYSYTFTVDATGFTAVLAPQNGAPAVTSGPQQTQQLVSAVVRVKSGASLGYTGIQVRTFALTAPNDINPGGSVIPQDGYIVGNTLGVNYTTEEYGYVHVLSDDIIGAFAIPSDGVGVVVNTAPLTGLTTYVTIKVWSAFAYGTSLRSTAVTGCTSDVTTTQVSGDCRVSFTESNTAGHDALEVTCDTALLSGTTARLQVWSPVVPLTLTVDTALLQQIELEPGVRLQTTECATAYVSARVRGSTAFVTGTDTTPEVDVTHHIASRMAENVSGIVETYGGRRASVTGISAGTVELSFGNAALGTVSVTVATSAVTITGFNVAAFSGLGVTLTPTTGIQTAAAAFYQGNLTQESAPGQQQLVAWISLSNGIAYNALVDGLDLNISFSSDDTDTLVVAGTVIQALGSGYATITASLTQGCDVQTLVSSPAEVGVLLPAADSAYISNNGGTSLPTLSVSHVADAAYLAGVAPREMRVKVKVVYPEYTSDLTDDVRTTLTASAGAPFTIGPCTQTSGTCVLPTADVNGVGTVTATFSHETVTAVTTVTVIEGTSLLVTAWPYPAYTGSAPVTGLALIDGTSVYQRARIDVVLTSSDASETGYPSDGMTYVNTDGTNAVWSASSGDDVVAPANAGTLSVSVQLGALTSPTVAITVTDTPVTVTAFDDLAVPGTTSNTVHVVRDSASSKTLRYAATFSDGSYITRTAMFNDFDGTFRGLLASFSSADTAVFTITSAGAIVSKANAPTTVALTVIAVSNATIFESIAMYSNLAHAGSFDADFATSSSRVGTLNPIETVVSGATVRVKVYVSCGSVDVSTLTMEMDFDSSLLTFVSVATGTDDTVWGDAVLGEVRTDNDDVVRFLSSTTSYATGNNWHFATIEFLSTGAGTVVFSGRIVQLADEVPTVLIVDATINAGHETSLVITGARRSRYVRPPARMRRQVAGCTAGVGPYPLGDVDEDCAFTGVDLVWTTQYVLINDDAGAASAWLTSTGNNLANMDADFNTVINTGDLVAMIYILAGGMRFARVPTVSYSLSGDCRMNISVGIEQASSDGTYAADPARNAKTAIIFLLTGTTGMATTMDALEWAFTSLDSVADTGQSAGYVYAAADVNTGLYNVETDAPLGETFGVSIVQVVQTVDGWNVPSNSQYLLTGNPYAAGGLNENTEANLAATFTVAGNTVPFFYTAPFAPFAVITVDALPDGCTMSPIATPTATPTVAPTATPTSTPTLALTATPTAMPTSPTPTVAPTATPTVALTATPTAMPTDTPTNTPTAAPTALPTIEPTASPISAPTFAPSSPTSVPTLAPTAQPTAPTTKHTQNPTSLPTVSAPPPPHIPFVSPIVFLMIIVPCQAMIFFAMWWKRREQQPQQPKQPPPPPPEYVEITPEKLELIY